MRRLPLLAPLLLFTAACGVVQSSEAEATDAARQVAQRAGERLYGQRPRTAEEVGRSAAGIDGVEVLRVTGTSTHEGDGVEVLVRTSGSAYDDGFDATEVVVLRCFSIRVSPESEWREEPGDVRCPDGPPLRFAPPPEPPRLPYEELRALATLDLDPAVHVEVKADGGRVGVLLSVEGNGWDAQDCVLARVVPGASTVWSPPRIQRMPGEGGCTVANALDPLPPPH
ncbi:translation initiation factor IF-2 [Streptomyces sp. NPDC005899]|uniref:translation initiation factor IF-2 n=1 Tax=Streptomyces sp. NPDC005899 TaxID=3155716 RepID=UPI003410AB14